MLKRMTASLSLVLIAGCSSAPVGKIESPVPMAREFAEGKAFAAAGAVKKNWWTLLDDPVLASLIERAVEANIDVRIAGERLLQAKASIAGAEAARLPGGGVFASSTRRRMSDFERAPLNGAPQVGTRYDAGFDASWEIDVFGRLSGQIDAARANHAAASARLEDVQLLVAAEVARNWFAILGAQERRLLAEASLSRQQSIARLVATRAREGYAEPLDEKRALADLRLAEALLPGIDSELATSRMRLAVLLGENPSTFRIPPPQTGSGAAFRTIQIGRPEHLLATRPDLREAEARIQGQRATVHAIRAEFLPRLLLTGVLGFVAGSLSGLGGEASESWSISPRLGIPIFDYPRIKARLDGARAEERQALLVYQARILTALEDVETSLARYRLVQERLTALRQRAVQAEGAAMLARRRYEAGRSDFLELLEAERTATAALIDAVLAGTEHRIALVSIFKAFGAGWTE